MSAPIPPSESTRLCALYDCGVLDTGPEAPFDDLTRLVARICAVPMALVSLVDADRQWFKSRVGVQDTETPREISFCAHVVAHGQRLIVEDASRDPRFCTSPLVSGAPNIRFYAGVPMRTSDGHTLGSFCVLDTKPRKLDPAQLEALEALARQAASQLELLRTVRRLDAARAEIDRARVLAEKANQAKSEFLSNMSHEMRTPLSAILGFADLLHGHELSGEAAAEGLSSIRRSAEHLMALINDLLDLAKIEAGELTLNSSAFSPWDALRDGAALIRSKAEAKGLSLLLQKGEGVPDLVKGDATRVRQTLAHVLSNAVKFTERGAVHARIDGAAGRLVFTVEDSGIGMSSDELSRLFKPFRQADGSPSRRFGGAGLGLSLTKRLVEAMGGTIEAESQPQRGTTLTITLPLPAASAPVGLTSPSAPARLDNLRILLAEDGEDNQRLIRHVLERAGASVHIAENGAEAVDAALGASQSPQPFDLILMDIQMPLVDGCAATRRLRAEGYTGPIVALTAHAMAGDRERCLRCGCDDYTTKPIDRKDLLARCAKWAGVKSTAIAAAA